MNIKLSILSLLIKLSEEELLDFNNYLKSSYHNHSKIILQLFHYLNKEIREGRTEELSIEKISTHFIKKKTFENSEVRSYISKLQKLLIDYLSFKKFRSEELLRKRLELEILNENNSFKIFSREATDFLKKFKTELPSSNTYIEQSRILSIIGNHYEIFQNTKNYNYYQEKDHNRFNIDLYVILHMYSEIVFNCVSLLIENLMSKYDSIDQNKIKLINSVEDYINRNKDIIETKDFIFFELYSKLFKCFLNFDDQKYYYEFKNFLMDNINNIHEEEFKIQLQGLIDYSILKDSSSKDIEFAKELYEYYYLYISHDFYLTSFVNVLIEERAINFLKLAVRVNRLKQATDLLKEKSAYMKDEFRDHIFNYSKALYHFDRSEFGKSLNFINKFNFNYQNCKPDYKFLYIKLLLELGEFNIALGFCETFLNFIKKIPNQNDVQRENRINFLKNCRTICRCYNNKLELAYLKSKIEQQSDTIFKHWLINICEKYQEKLL